MTTRTPPPLSQRATLILLFGLIIGIAAGALTVLDGHTIYAGLLAGGAAAGAAAALLHVLLAP